VFPSLYWLSGLSSATSSNSKKQGIQIVKKVALRLILCSALLGGASAAIAQEPTPVAPDNSAVNAADRAPAAMTATKQSNAKGDINLTRQIRRAVVKDSSLSTMAHNVKIITVGGHVTLRGPVKTEKEKTDITAKAEAIAGAGNVDDQLHVKGQ
jgi:hyperosmotically inducible periplasmic protein